MNKLLDLESENIKTQIYTVRGKQVMIDRDLAKLYGVETKVFNQAVKRNRERFPEYFRFQLTQDEYFNLRSQFVTSSGNIENNYGGDRYLPYVFTEQGVSMLSAVLKSPTAIEISIKIIDNFVSMKHFLSQNALVFQKFEHIDKKILQYDKQFTEVFQALEGKENIAEQGIFYNGQIFDAHNFISKLIRSAENSLILIDNYIDDATLTLFQKNTEAKVTLVMKKMSASLKNDIDKYEKQYQKITVIVNNNFHDRFLILDEKEVYHIGASLKDLGKKVFAFSLLQDLKAAELLRKI